MPKKLLDAHGNPYLREYQTSESVKDRYSLRLYHERESCVKKYSWAIPTDEAIAQLVKYSPIIEIGAGLGYWAALAHIQGCVYDAYDQDISNKNAYVADDATPWFPVREGSIPELADHPGSTLFLCWPDYDSSFAFDALKAYKGERVIYVGEGEGGCTGDDAFHERLNRKWNHIGNVELPQWPGIHDFMSIWERKH